MYELPSLENVNKVVVDETVVNHESPPILIYGNEEPKQSAAGGSE
jgi:ATP-dependent Clp protease ATP-binding subunit ClpX